MRKIIYFLFIGGSLSLMSCEEDFKITAPYKETTVIYGLLNPHDKIQYIRINKTFLGEGDATVMAQQSDSINFKPSQLEVKLEQYKDGLFIKSLKLKPDTIIKEDGAFAKEQLLYVTYDPNDTIVQDGSIYKLTVKNKKNDVVSTAETAIISGIIPMPAFGKLSTVNFIDSRGDPALASFSYYTGTGAKVFQPIIRFYYIEEYADGITPAARKYVEYDLSEQISGDDLETIPVDSKNFIDNIIFNLSSDSNVKNRRIIDTLDYELTAVNEEFYNYIQVNKPSSGIAQEKPEYTNISNGIGFFSCRDKVIKEMKLGDYTLRHLVGKADTKFSFPGL